MKILPRFLARRYAKNLFLVLGIVCGVIFAISFMQDIAAAPTLLEALDDAFAHFLEMFPMFLPLVAFMATLLTFYRLLLSSELVIVQSAGLSAYQVMRPMLMVAAIFGIFTLTVMNPLATAYNRADLRESRIVRIDNAVWLREKTNDGSIVIRAMEMAYTEGGLSFTDASLIKLNDNHQITERIIMENMVLEDGSLFAKNARILDYKGRENFRDFSLPTSMTPENIIRQYLKPNQISFWELPEFIRELEDMGIPTQMHRLQFLSLLFLPFVLMSMTVLGVMFSQTRERRNFSFAKQFGAGIITCFIVYFIIQVFNALASSGTITPLLAVFFPPAIVLFFAATRINRSDNM